MRTLIRTCSETSVSFTSFSYNFCASFTCSSNIGFTCKLAIAEPFESSVKQTFMALNSRNKGKGVKEMLAKDFRLKASAPTLALPG
ncbi:hypothetical protein MTR67_023271 [Solanum verrucosum]|uniref:Uncharacterized protein n=1 Tax=Solanum verrucosum TaxID=315347 RepID=A0AAF0TRP0_SOLVR|nr:hypothetical protein MTR67_023271 [Solanum verrucosum]